MSHKNGKRARRNLGVVRNPKLGAAVAALRAGALEPGKSYQARHWHDPHCRYPQGGECTCLAGGPEVELVEM